MKKSKAGDAHIVNGTCGYGWCATDEEFIRPDYNRVRQQGKERAVGMFATSKKPGVVNPRGDL